MKKGKKKGTIRWVVYIPDENLILGWLYRSKADANSTAKINKGKVYKVKIPV